MANNQTCTVKGGVPMFKERQDRMQKCHWNADDKTIDSEKAVAAIKMKYNQNVIIKC